MSKITINGKSYPIQVDGFGLTIVAGKPVNEFMETLSPQDITWLAKYGMTVVQNEPEHFDDISERIEMPHDIKQSLDSFKVNPTNGKDKQ